MEKTLLPYYYPTTVVMVDDDAEFLHLFGLQLPHNLAFTQFTSPRQALHFIETTIENTSSFIQNGEVIDLDHLLTDKRLSELDLPDVEQRICDIERFREISVAIADYDMEEMNGLELCRRVHHMGIKTILLSGIADEHLAIQAFNDGVIDKFLRKGDGDILDKLNHSVAQMQSRYCYENCALLRELIALKEDFFLHDPVFCSVFRALLAEEKIIEYYLIDKPNGFIMVNEYGSLYRLIVLTNAELQINAEQAQSLGAPKHIIESIREGVELVYFGYEPELDEYDTIDWQEHLYETKHLTGMQHYSLIKNPPADIDYEPEINNYKHFLHHLDHGW